MKNFNYTARDKAGATKRGSIKALDRNAALHELTAQGMVPLSIIEGAAVNGASGLPNLKPFIIAGGIAAVLVGVFLAFQLLPKRSGGAENLKKSKIVQTTKKMTTATTKDTATNTAVSVAKTSEKTLSVTEPSISTNAVAKPPIQVIELYPGCSTNPPLTGYTSLTERFINMVINTRPGMPPLPLFNLPANETNIIKILEANITVYDTDDEKTVQQKANVAYAKQLLKEYVAAGGNTKDFLGFYHEQLKIAFEERSTAQKQFSEILKAGDEKGATEFFEEKNKELSEKGIVPLMVPPRFKKKTE